jgi:hypothetical protein
MTGALFYLNSPEKKNPRYGEAPDFAVNLQ